MKTVLQETFVSRKPELKLLKSLVAVCGLLLLLPSAHAVFSWPVYEPFSEYITATPFQLGTNDSLNFWNFGNNTTNGVASYIVTPAAAMSYPALLPDPSNNVPGAAYGVQEVPGGPGNNSADRAAFFTQQTGTIYVSFLLNYQNNGGAIADKCAFSLYTGGTSTTNGGSASSIYTAVWLTPDYRLQVTKNYRSASANFSAATPVLSTNVPHLIVMRYLRSVTPNEVDLWVDPAPFGDDTRIPPPTISTTNAPDIANFNSFLLSYRKLINNTYYLNEFQIDEIRLDSTWSGVTPLGTPSPGPMFTVAGGGIGCPGDTFPVTLSGSVATNDYWLYTNSIYAGVTMTGNGSALNLGSFSAAANYSVLASNNVNGNLGWMSNSVSVYVRAPVNVVTEPIPAVTATNNRAQFVVSVTGDQLSYQWYKDGTPLANDAHITGSTSNTLVIWPATSADTGGYYCSITNPCSSSPTYTTTNPLTLSAPNNLVYYGNHFTTPPLAAAWDISTSPSWNGGGVVFNEGDNVTFDDSYSGTQYGQIIPLTGTLTPTLITYSTGQQLIFGGNGSIAGPGELLLTGLGRLIISNTVGAGTFQANPYTGGTVISNGTVYVQATTALGTGPITLAGGALETLGKLSFSNNVFVTGNSACQLDQSGNQSITLLGPLIGNSGTTLVLTNSNPLTNSPNWVNLNASLTNNSAIVLAVNSLATNSTQRVVLNNGTNGPQIFNGVISEASAGVGGMIKQGSGPVYLNAANTYTLSTSNTAGLLAGSGSISSPLFVYTNGTLGGGSPNAIGTFTVNSTVTLNGGNVFIRVDKSLAQSNDLISAIGIITNAGTGTVTVTNLNLAMPLVAGDKYQIFSGAVKNGDLLAVIGGGVGWANNLAVDGSIQAVNAIAAYPTNITISITGGTQSLSWPATHLGWILQSQTNSLSAGLGTNWYDIPASAAYTNLGFPSHTNAVVFYRLRHP